MRSVVRIPHNEIKPGIDNYAVYLIGTGYTDPEAVVTRVDGIDGVTFIVEAPERRLPASISPIHDPSQGGTE